MLKSIINTALRNIFKFKLISFINIIGFAISITAAVLLLLYVNFESSFEDFQVNKNNVFRVLSKIKNSEGQEDKTPLTIFSSAEFLHLNNSSIKNTTVVFKSFYPIKLKIGGKYFFEENVIWADTNFFDVFSYSLYAGNPVTALTRPGFIAISKSKALKLFGTENILDKTINVNNQDYKITAVLEPLPTNTHLQFDYVISIVTFSKQRELDNYGMSFAAYLNLENNRVEADITAIEKMHSGYLKNYFNNIGAGVTSVGTKLEKLSDLHLFGEDYPDENKGNILYVYLLLLLTAGILIVASLNYVNIMTAQAENRTREIFLRKVLGADRIVLIRQILVESILITLISILISVFLIQLVIEPFEQLIDRDISSSINSIWVLGLYLIAGGMLIGFTSGLYPAVFLSGHSSAFLHKNVFSKGRLRKILITIQFGISVFLITNVVVINSQVEFMNNRDIGLDKECTLVLKNLSVKIKSEPESFRNHLLNESFIRSAAYSLHVPGQRLTYQLVKLESEGQIISIPFIEMHCSAGFSETLGFKLIEGRNFQQTQTLDNNTVLINNTAKKLFGNRNILNNTIDISNMKEARVVGIIEDFNLESQRNRVKPLFIRLIDRSPIYFVLKLNNSNNIKELASVINRFDDSYQMDYVFIQDIFNKLLDDEKQKFYILLYSSMFAVFISLMGLVAFITYLTAKKYKEIGIRKVMGGSTRQITTYLLKGLFIWMLTGVIISYPFSYLVINEWLQNFHYRVTLSIFPFIGSALMVIAVAFASIIFQIIKAARLNPADTIRCE